jgi:hypothetical protein
MSKKHFIAIAKALNLLWRELDEGSAEADTFQVTVSVLVGQFRQLNDNFDANRFRDAVYAEVSAK